MPVTQEASEREIELWIVNRIRDVLLQLGKGFTFVGNQYPLKVGNEHFFIDLLFFNLELNCYVVIELKKGKFKPEHSGKLNFYISVVDDFLKKPHHEATLGFLLCESRDRVVAEYALSRTESPMAITRYKLPSQIPEALQSVLPSIDELEERLSRAFA